MTNWMSALLAARLERIAGIATFTIETSSSTMNSAVITLAEREPAARVELVARGSGRGRLRSRAGRGCEPRWSQSSACLPRSRIRSYHARGAEVHLARVPSGAGTRVAPVHLPASGPFSAVCTIPTASTANIVATWLRRMRRRASRFAPERPLPANAVRTSRPTAAAPAQMPISSPAGRVARPTDDRQCAMPATRRDGAEPVVRAEPCHREAASRWRAATGSRVRRRSPRRRAPPRSNR